MQISFRQDILPSSLYRCNRLCAIVLPYDVCDTCRESLCCRRQLKQDGDLLRLTVDTRDWSLQQRHLVPGPVSTDFSVINPAFNMRPYTYIFTVYGIYTDTPQSLVKASRRRNFM